MWRLDRDNFKKLEKLLLQQKNAAARGEDTAWIEEQIKAIPGCPTTTPFDHVTVEEVGKLILTPSEAARKPLRLIGGKP